MEHQKIARLRPKRSLEDKYWELESKIADISSRLGMTRAEMFDSASILPSQTRHEVALIVLAQRKLLTEAIRRKNSTKIPAKLVILPGLNR